VLRQRAGERQVAVPADDAGRPVSGNPSAVYGRLNRRPMPSARVQYVPDAAGLEELVVKWQISYSEARRRQELS
jgi:hypothetical protein